MNTDFSYFRQRLAVTMVRALRDSLGQLHTCPDEILEMASLYYEALFTSDPLTQDVHDARDEVWSFVRPVVSEDMQIAIMPPFSLQEHLNEDKILSSISLVKDVDGCHPSNIGSLANGKQPLFVPCTAKACLQILLKNRIQLSGRYAVVIGCGNIAGLPISLLLQKHNATVTRVHALTETPEDYTRRADIVIAAAGCPNLVRGDWLKKEAVIVDVGISHTQDSLTGDLHLVGDVCIEEARKVASVISPVPGGVGPVTIAMLLQNTILAAQSRHGLKT
ncbi:hypothetical protein L7F22_046589 [Adiantum nelumboides]|nr:hypothetical protein [Adiantum nelumboides]